MKPIVGLVGPSGSGKTTLIEDMIRRYPDRVGVVKSLTTRPRRGPEDDPNYDFIDVEEMRKREATGHLVQISEYAGHLYAHDWNHLNELLSEKIGICALVEQGVRNLRAAKLDVRVVDIIPRGGEGARDQVREVADKKRAATELAADVTIVNDFGPGGLERAADTLSRYIESLN